MENSNHGEKRPSDNGNKDGEPAEKRRRVPTLASVVIEAVKMDSLQKLGSSLEPMLRRVVSEEVERALMRLLPSALPRLSGGSILARVEPPRLPAPGERRMRLQFRSRLALPLFTGGKVEGEGGTAVHVVLQDASTGHVIMSGEHSSLKLEVCVLEGDFVADDDEDWAEEEFERNIVRERDGKRPLLTGDLSVTLKEGVGALGELTFTDNSSWIRSRKFRLGVRIAPGQLPPTADKGGSEGGEDAETGAALSSRIREGKTEAFTVKDHRGELYKKHYPPALHDEVWRLDRIGKDGAFHKRLNQAGVFTVEDFLRLVVMDPQKLRNILGSGMSNKMWEGTVEHAKTCVLHGKLHVYYADEKQNIGVIFNDIFQLMGLIADGQYMSVDLLSESEKIYVDKLVKVAYENYEKMVAYDEEDLIGVKDAAGTAAGAAMSTQQGGGGGAGVMPSSSGGAPSHHTVESPTGSREEAAAGGFAPSGSNAMTAVGGGAGGGRGQSGGGGGAYAGTSTQQLPASSQHHHFQQQGQQQQEALPLASNALTSRDFFPPAHAYGSADPNQGAGQQMHYQQQLMQQHQLQQLQMQQQHVAGTQASLGGGAGMGGGGGPGGGGGGGAPMGHPGAMQDVARPSVLGFSAAIPGDRRGERQQHGFKLGSPPHLSVTSSGGEMAPLSGGHLQLAQPVKLELAETEGRRDPTSSASAGGYWGQYAAAAPGAAGMVGGEGSADAGAAGGNAGYVLGEGNDSGHRSALIRSLSGAMFGMMDQVEQLKQGEEEDVQLSEEELRSKSFEMLTESEDMHQQMQSLLGLLGDLAPAGTAGTITANLSTGDDHETIQVQGDYFAPPLDASGNELVGHSMAAADGTVPAGARQEGEVLLGGGIQPSNKVKISWFKLKAALRWGIFMRKRAAEKQAARLVELEEE